ncbi:MAG: hypothetical protein ABR589_03165, partial [Chthoniobacterales bacterium]
LDPAHRLFGKKYNIKVDEALREITITEPVQLKKIPEKPYVPPTEPLPQPTVLPNTTAPDQ